MSSELMRLEGCTPTPLVSYLKSLGLLKLISSDVNHVQGRAADSKARGWWENESFHLRTALDRRALTQFFLYEYAPSPIVAPWNGRAGFLEGEAKGVAGEIHRRPKAERMARVEKSESPRLRNLRKTVTTSRTSEQIESYNHVRANRKELEKRLKIVGEKRREILEQQKKIATQYEKEIKSVLLPTIRSTTDLQHLAYIDTCYVLSSETVPAPLLVGGGVDGSQEFGSDFVEALEFLFDFHSGTPNRQCSFDLSTAVFGEGHRLDRRGAFGLFTPMQSGLKSTTGFEVGGDKKIYPLNSWDVVLAMEGTMVFAGALTRRWGATGDTRAAFPFTFEPVRAGTGSLSSADPNRPRSEIWTPLWRKPATFSEIAATFAEGRLTVGRRSARTGLDAARSVARIGQARGISGFERYSLIQPDSKMPYQATPLGRFTSPAQPRSDLIEDLGGRRLVAKRTASCGG